MKKKIFVVALMVMLASLPVFAKKAEHNTTDYSVGMLFIDAANTSNFYHVDGWACDDGTENSAPDCVKDKAFIKFQLADGRSGFFVLMDLVNDRYFDPLGSLVSHFNQKVNEIKVSYRITGDDLFIPYKDGNRVKEAHYQFIEVGALKDLK